MLRLFPAAAWPAVLLALLVTACDQEPKTLTGPVAVYQGPPPKHGLLGIQFVPGANTPVVGAVVPGGPAQLSGVAEGDVIVSVDGKAVSSPQEVTAALSDKSPGTTATVELSRGGQRSTVTAQLMGFMDLLALEQQAAKGRTPP